VIPGTLLAQIGRRVVRRDTYDRIIEPAVADLQYESSTGSWPMLRGYVGVWRAMIAALVGEVATDCVNVCRSAQVSRVALPMIASGGIALLWHGRFLWEIGRGPTPWHHTLVFLVLWIPTITALIAPPVALPLAAMFASTKHPGARRAAVLLAAAVISAIVVTGQRTALKVQPLWRDLLFSSAWSRGDGLSERPIWQLRQLYRPRLEEIASRERRHFGSAGAYQRTLSHRDLALTFSTFSFALIGAVLATRARWLLTMAAGLLLLANVGAEFVFVRVLYVQAVTGWMSAIWAPVTLVFLLCAWIAVRRSREPETRTSNLEPEPNRT